MELKGFCYFWSETGTEGGWWAFLDERFIGGDANTYEGLHVLHSGDYLVISSPEDGSVVWEGEIDLTPTTIFKDSIFNFWIHNRQKGVDMEEWSIPFFKEWPATLKKK